MQPYLHFTAIVQDGNDRELSVTKAVGGYAIGVAWKPLLLEHYFKCSAPPDCKVATKLAIQFSDPSYQAKRQMNSTN